MKSVVTLWITCSERPRMNSITFELIALLVGVTSGVLLVKLYGQILMLVLYHFPFRFWRPYSVLYEKLDSEYSYNLLGGDKLFKNFREFIHLHEKQRDRFNDRFRRLWDAYALKIVLAYSLVLLAALALFWSVYEAFIVSFMIVQLVGMFYDRYAKNQDLDLYVTLMLKLILTEPRDERTAS